MASKLVETRERLIAKQRELSGMFAAHPDLDFSDDEAATIKALNTEMSDLGKEVGNLAELEKIGQAVASVSNVDAKGKAITAPLFPTGQDLDDEGRMRERGVKSIGELFVDSPAFKDYDRVQKKGPTAEIDLFKEVGKLARFGIKATLDTATGYAPQAIRLPTLITPGEMGLTVADLLPQAQTTQVAIVYMEETTTTNAAAETAQSGLKPEAGIAFTERTTPVAKIAVFLPVTDEMFQDVPMMEGYVNNRLRTFVLQREDGQLLNGDGSAPNLRGILNTSGIQTQAKGSDPVPDAIFKGITKIGVNGFLDASGIVMHHNDWQDIRLLRTVDGIYIWGNPSEAGPERLWGLPVVKTTRIAEGTALVGAFRDGAQIFRRSELAFAVSDSHSDFFQRNLLAIRAEERLALAVFRPKAFCTVTGI